MNFERRRSRERCFRIFARIFAQDYINEISNKYKEHSEISKFTYFYAALGGRIGYIDDRTFEVRYGQRPVAEKKELVQRPDGLPRVTNRLLAEQGACLTYSMTMSGLVHCQLFPCAVEGYRRKEDFILLDYGIDPRELTGTRVLNSHFRSLISYYQVTSIDGEPKLRDKIRVKRLMWGRDVCIDGVLKSKKIYKYLFKIVSFALTVGLSGFILYFLQLITKGFCK